MMSESTDGVILNNSYLFYVFECFAFMYVCAAHVCLMQAKAKRRCWFPWDQHKAVSCVGVLGVQPRSSDRAASALTAEPFL